ncbi:MAG: PAS domain S-box protein [Candidatus Solibacter usitatus]|nr:PAS domain S-box protein [Candidatus Solibacter usitatus]
MADKKWFWATLALSSTTIMLVVLAAWELVENHFFRDATYLTLHYLYITRGIASSLLLGFWAAWFVLRQRRQSEEDLRHSQERYRGLLEVIPGAVVLYDGSLSVLEWNASAERMYGYLKTEMQGQPLPTIPAEKKDELNSFLSLVRAGKPVLDIETTRLNRDGDPFEVLLNLLPFQEPSGATYFLEVTSDIRERVRWRERMLQIEKLTSMGKMAAGTAHHLNSPLAALILRVQMMQERGGQSSADDLNRLQEGLEFCRHFVQRLLEFTRTAPLQEKPQELGALIESVASFFAPVILAKGAALRVEHGDSGGVSVRADRNQLETVLLILLSNALDAVEPGGEIRVRCGRTPSGNAVMEVIDNGAGITAANMAHVFEPFFTTKEPGKGTGLGLAIARNVIAEHGGIIDIGSEPGSGVTVRVELPLAEPASGKEAAA